MKRQKTTILMVAALTALLLTTPNVWAGCGCDHPTPCPAPVMPPFASPGDTVKLSGDDFSTEDSGNKVSFGSGFSKSVTYKKAKNTEQLVTDTPDDWSSSYTIGPMPIKVENNGSVVAEYSSDDFTYLNDPLVLDEGQGHYLFYDYTLAVDSFGVLYIPLDLTNISEATNFMVYIDDLPLEYTADNVLIYNKDGFNLNLFTLDVEGIEKQWGEWYGVQGMENQNPNGSNAMTYWRHEFHTYKAAHAPGGEYYAPTENEDGYLVHNDGTIHVDHDRLVVAVNGKLRDPNNPDDESAMTSLKPGKVARVNIHILQLQTDDPDVWDNLSAEQEQILVANRMVTTPSTSGFVPYNPSDLNGYDFSFPWEELMALISGMFNQTNDTSALTTGGSLFSGWTFDKTAPTTDDKVSTDSTDTVTDQMIDDKDDDDEEDGYRSYTKWSRRR